MNDRPFQVRATQPERTHAPLPAKQPAHSHEAINGSMPSGKPDRIAEAVLVVSDDPGADSGSSFAVRRLVGACGRLVDVPGFSEGLSHLAQPTDIDLVLYDVGTPAPDRVATLVRHAGTRPVVVFATSERSYDIRAAARTGASGYVIKSQPPAVLHHALRLALAGCGYFPADLLMCERTPYPAPNPPPPLNGADAPGRNASETRHQSLT